MAEVEGVHLKITGDSSQAVKEIEKTQQAVDNIKDQKVEIKVEGKVDALGKLHKANGQFMTMGEKLASSFSSGFMKKAAEWSVKFDSWGKSLEKTTNGIFKNTYSIVKGVVAANGALGLFLKNTMSIGGNFEAQITNVKVISGATETELDMLTKKAREMGAALPITAKDAATAMELLAQRGTNAKDILASVADVSALAISQSVDMGSAADLLGSTMTNFGIDIENASKVTDIFNNASNQSALNMSKLIEAMKYVGPAAGAMGMELAEAMSAMEVAANAGLSGEMIGSGLSMTLSVLASKSEILGVRTRNLDGSMRSLREIFSELQERGFSLSDATDVFGARASKVALSLAKYSSSLEENERNLQQWGSTQAAVNEKMKAWPNVWNAFKSATEEVHIEIFTQIKEQSKEAITNIADLTREFSNWIQKTQLAGKSLNAFIEGLGFKIPSGEDFKKLLEDFDIQSVIDKFKSFGSTIKSIGNVFVKFYNVIKIPLTFLINHIEAFATISFWGWLGGKGLQIPLALINIASGFVKLKNAIAGFAAVKAASILSSIIALLSNPVLLGAAGITAGIIGIVSYLDSLPGKFKKIREEKAKIQRELKEEFEAGEDAEYYVKINFKTGFEELPESYERASKEVKEAIKSDVEFMKKQFRTQVGDAIELVKNKFPETVEDIKIAINGIDDEILAKISKSLQMSDKDFASLPVFWQRVTEEINNMNLAVGQGSAKLTNWFETYRLLQSQTESLVSKNGLDMFSNEISRKIERLFMDMPANLERLEKFLDNKNLDLALNVSLSEAQKQLEEFSESVSKKYSIPIEIADEIIFSKLKQIANKGDETAQALSQGWRGASSSLDNFISRAEDAINYLNESPAKFIPALNSLSKNIQKIDSVTKKVNDQFKKVYDTLKQWTNITFDKLSQQIQRLKKAVEGGFINKSALEAEFKRVSAQVKLQVITELEPTKSQYKSRDAYSSVVASEYVSRMQELGGDYFLQMIKKEFSPQSGADIGRHIIAQITKGIQSNPSSYMMINGKNVGEQASSQNLSLTFTNALNPLVTKMEQLVSQQQSAPVNYASDYSSAVNTIVSAIREVTEAVKSQKQNSNAQTSSDETVNASFVRNIQSLEESISSLRKSNEDNISALNQVQNALRSIDTGNSSASSQQDLNPLINSVQNILSSLPEIRNAVNSVETAIKSMSQGNNYDIDINQHGFVIQQKSDADSLARSTVSALRSGIGNGGL